MKKKIRVIISLVMIALLAACAKEPANLGKHVEEGNPTEDKSNNSDIALEPIQKVLEQAKDIKKSSFDNLYFSFDFEVNQPEQIGKLEFKQRSHFEKDGMERLKEFIKEPDPNIEIETNFEEPGLQYIDEEKQKSFSLGDNGSLYYSIEEGDSWLEVKNYESEEYTLVKQINVDNTYEDENFGGKLTLGDVVKAAQKHADTFTEKYDSMSWKPNVVNVYQDKKKHYFFDILFIKEYQGVDLFYGDYRRAIDQVKDLYVSVMRPFMVLNEDKKMLAIDNFAGIIDYQKTLEEYDKIITLQSASTLLSNKLTSYKAYNVYDVNLEYRLVRTNGKDVERNFEYTNWYAGNTYEARPCWTFYLSNELDNMTFAMVDCITGEVEFVSGE